VLGAVSHAQVSPTTAPSTSIGGQIPQAPPPIQPSPEAAQALQDATAPRFTRAPTGTVPLRGRAPGDQFQFETTGGERPLRYELTVQPTAFAPYFSVIGVRTGGTVAPDRTGSSATAVTATQLMAVKFAGLPASQAFPPNIEVFLRVMDARDRRVEKLFNVRLTNSGSAPAIRNLSANHGKFSSTVYLETTGFDFAEQGSRIEMLYRKTGLRYRCVPQDNCVTGDSAQSGFRQIWFVVPRLQDQGRDVDIRLVNDTATSASRAIRLADGFRDVQWLDRVPGSVLALGAEFTGTNPERLPGSRDDCDKEYAAWHSISDPFNVITTPQGRPATVSIKSKPALGSAMENGREIVYTWSGAIVDSVQFSVQVEYYTYLGKCAGRVLGG
jgi:hypothetical protein